MISYMKTERRFNASVPSSCPVLSKNTPVSQSSFENYSKNPAQRGRTERICKSMKQYFWYNNPSYSRILFGSCLWSIREQKHRWQQDSIQNIFFQSYVILWTNHNSLVSIATNQLATFCIDNRSCRSAIFVSVKVTKFETKRLIF